VHRFNLDNIDSNIMIMMIITMEGDDLCPVAE